MNKWREDKINKFITIVQRDIIKERGIPYYTSNYFQGKCQVCNFKLTKKLKE